ncbi:MAG: hypothetical protein PHQ96_06770 [Candidatus Omnitrophica bacterium]|nr:hypothetical protein [Candidatus Omnitrophota bacterium]
MHVKRLVGFTVLALLILSICVPVFAESKKEYMDQLNQARKDYTVARDKLHDQNRILLKSWLAERAEYYKQLKASPGDKAIHAKLNDGVKKFLADKKDVYLQLDKQKEEWLKLRADLGAKIKSAS